MNVGYLLVLSLLFLVPRILPIALPLLERALSTAFARLDS